MQTGTGLSAKVVMESYWREFRFGVDSPYGVAARAAKRWGSNRSKITIEENWTGWPFVRWADIRGQYVASFPREGKLTVVSHDFRLEPTLSQIIDCLGPPEYYLAYCAGQVGFGRLYVDLWYPKRGTVVTHYSFYEKKELPSIPPSLRMSSYRVVAPGPLEKIATDAYPYGLTRALEYQPLCPAKPWPGTIEAMEVESLLGADPPCKQP